MKGPCRLLAAVLALSAAACGDGPDSSTAPTSPQPAPTPAPSVGAIGGRAAPVGAGRDPDGYLVLLDWTAVGEIAAQGVLALSAVPPGHHTVGLAGIAPSCDPHAGGPSELEVAGRDTTVVDFTSPCPGLATVRVVTHTTGTEADPDGYVVNVAGAAQAIGTEDTIDVADVPAGLQEITIGGLADNCFLPTPRQRINLPPGQTTVATFEVSCLRPTLGAIIVSVSTTAILFPSDLTFAVELDGGHRLPVPSKGTVSYPDVEAGRHTIRLVLPRYCGVGLFGGGGVNPVRIELQPGERRTVGFQVLCIG